jgi:hypothetical protein
MGIKIKEKSGQEAERDKLRTLLNDVRPMTNEELRQMMTELAALNKKYETQDKKNN